METPEVVKKRVVAYVDGFNLYFGLRSAGWQRYYWLDVVKLVESVLEPNSELTGVKYFTSPIESPEDKRKRQVNYLEALEIVSKLEILRGKYQFEDFYCQDCSYKHSIPKEKMTDVNIAVEMMTDAFQERFDTALLISGDSDLTPPIKAVLRLFPEKRVIVAFPPERHAKDLREAASASFTLPRAKFRDAQLPDEVTKPGGYVLKRPDRWR